MTGIFTGVEELFDGDYNFLNTCGYRLGKNYSQKLTLSGRHLNGQNLQ
jgi:hypothetical protein